MSFGRTLVPEKRNMIIGIVAIAKNFAIGKEGRLPWHYPADLKFFKETTVGNAVVMGFHTWESIGKPLPKRLNIVLSRKANLENRSDVLLLRSKEEVLALSKYLKGDLFIIGGAKTYENFADVIEKWLVTEVPADIEDADTFMPENFLENFELREVKKMDDDLRVSIYERP
jgi:dihydrofolate reductase